MQGPDPSFLAGWLRKLSPDMAANAAEAEREEEHGDEDYVAAKARADAARPRSRWGRIRRLLRPGL
jgi:hypothetical protein